MTTYQTLSAIHNLSVLGMDHPPIRDTMLDTIKKITDAGSPPPPARVTNVNENSDPAGLAKHFRCPNVAELRDYQTKGRIAAIKAYRERTGLSLKDAVDSIDESAGVLGLIDERYEKRPLATENENLVKLVADLVDIINERVAAFPCPPFTKEQLAVLTAARCKAKKYAGQGMPF